MKVTGTSILRACALRRVRKTHYAGLAQDVGITGDTFLAFAEGRRDLPPEKLQLLCKVFYPNGTRLDVERDLLVTGEVARDAPPFTTYELTNWPRGASHEIGTTVTMGKPRPEDLVPRKPRPGWA